jgi:hypothetical protein
VEQQTPAPRLVLRLISLGYLGATVLLIGGLYVAVLGRRLGAYLALTGLVLRIGGHLIAGVFAYRGVMNRPWPKVAQLRDDDE